MTNDCVVILFQKFLPPTFSKLIFNMLLRSKFRLKRSAAAKKTDTDQPDLQLSDGQTVTVDSTAPSDTGIISVPPKAFAASKDSVRRVSPSRFSLDDYKHRSSSSRASLDLDTSELQQRHPASLPCNPATLPLSGSREAVVDMEMSSQSSEKFGNFITGGDQHLSSGLNELAVQRKTRSQSRRQDRADSHDASEMTSARANMESDDKDDASASLEKKSSEASEKMLRVPRSLCIRKKGTSRSPSPLSSPKEEIPPVPPLSPARKNGSFRTPSPCDQSPLQPLSPKPPKTLIPAAPRNSPAFDVPPRDASMKDRLAFARARVPSPPLDDESKMVAVRPPMYDISKGLCQWVSDLPSTSRPDRVWEWPKRWTCCRCEATTIVEQKICSSLECSHYRCPNDCRMIRISRPLGQFVGFGG